MKHLFALVLSLLAIVSCKSGGGGSSVIVEDEFGKVAKMTFVGSHEFLQEYKREIVIYNDTDSKHLLLPPDTGGDLPIEVSRHKDGERDLLRLRGGIYHLVFDLQALDYAVGSDKPTDDIYTGEYRGELLPEAISEWVIDEDLEINRHE